jgi:hypothetical protein
VRTFRPALEQFEAREVPASLAWTDLTGSGRFGIASNWRDLSTGSPATAAPAQGDNLTFDGAITSANLNDLRGFGLSESVADFGAVQFINGYSGTVTVNPDSSAGLSVGSLALGTGALSQPNEYCDLSVLGTFTWTGGTLNSSPSTATVNVYGGGSIVLPGEGNTLTTGSTLSFVNWNPGGPEVTTTISGAGNLLLNGTSEDAIFVRAGAKVDRVGQYSSGGALGGLDNQNKKLTLDQGEFGYYGVGTETVKLRVVNNGGLFKLRDQVHIILTEGAAGEGYVNENNANSRLHITNGCTLEATKGVKIRGGSVYLIMNEALPAVDQVATIKGALSFLGGDIVFSIPLSIDNQIVYGTFKVQGDVVWAGGTYRPSVDCTVVGKANLWKVTGDLVVTLESTAQIAPIPQRLPQGQQPNGTWDVVIVDGAIQPQVDPTLAPGWQLITESNANGVKKKWSVKQ